MMYDGLIRGYLLLGYLGQLEAERAIGCSVPPDLPDHIRHPRVFEFARDAGLLEQLAVAVAAVAAKRAAEQAR